VLFEDDSAYRARTATLATVTFELTEFLVDVLGITDTGAHFDGKLAYHACCHLLRELGVDDQPRTLLAHIADAEHVDLVGDDECCGFGGLFAVKNAPISTAMGRRKTVRLAESDADVVALCDVSCMTHINGLLGRQAQRCRAVHIAQLLVNEVDVHPRPAEPNKNNPATQPSRRWQDAR
jgi:L-lactate dehydrogenase complex protein LldE